MKIDGGCHCGNVKYEAEVDPEGALLCHCTDCQKMSSAPYRFVLPTKEENLKMLANLPKGYVKTAESGNQRIQAFCPECGTHIYATSMGEAGKRMFSLRMGTVTQRDEIKPGSQKWCRSAQDWAFNIESLPRMET